MTRIETADHLTRATALRSRYFDGDVAANAAWMILLSVYAAQAAGDPIWGNRIVSRQTMSMTTYLRQLAILEAQGLIARAPAAARNRRQDLMLTTRAIKEIEQYLDAVAGPPFLRVRDRKLIG